MLIFREVQLHELQQDLMLRSQGKNSFVSGRDSGKLTIFKYAQSILHSKDFLGSGKDFARTFVQPGRMEII